MTNMYAMTYEPPRVERLGLDEIFSELWPILPAYEESVLKNPHRRLGKGCVGITVPSDSLGKKGQPSKSQKECVQGYLIHYGFVTPEDRHQLRVYYEKINGLDRIRIYKAAQ